MKYTYPVKLTPDDGTYLVSFPDFPTIHTEGDSLGEALDMAEDALNLMLWDDEEDGTPIPAPTDIRTIPRGKDEIVSLVNADTLAYRQKYDDKMVKKTLSIPKWLDTLATERHINFSGVLRNALVKELRI